MVIEEEGLSGRVSLLSKHIAREMIERAIEKGGSYDPFGFRRIHS
jgi:hypothetical protein